MTSEIAYTISNTSGLDPGRSVLTINSTKAQTKAQQDRQGNNVIQLNRQEAALKGKEGGDERAGKSDPILKTLQDEFNLINNVELKFNKDQETGQSYIEIVDKDSGDVVREIPPETLRKLAEKMDEMLGILFDKKA